MSARGQVAIPRAQAHEAGDGHIGGGFSVGGLAGIGVWVSTAIRLVLAGVFAWAGVAKMADPEAALRAVRAYRLLPEGLVKVFAWGLPFVEVALAVLLVAGLATRVAAIVAAGLFVIFIFSIASVWARGLQIDCGCFGGGGAAHVSAATYLAELCRDLVLLASALLLAWRPRTLLAADSA